MDGQRQGILWIRSLVSKEQHQRAVQRPVCATPKSWQHSTRLCCPSDHKKPLMAHGDFASGALSKKRAAEVERPSLSKKRKKKRAKKAPVIVEVEKKAEEPELLKKFRSILCQHANEFDAKLGPNF